MGCGASSGKSPAKYEASPKKASSQAKGRDDDDDDDEIEEYPNLPYSHVADLINAFEMLDLDSSGTIDTSEFDSATNNPAMKKLYQCAHPD